MRVWSIDHNGPKLLWIRLKCVMYGVSFLTKNMIGLNQHMLEM